MLITSVGEFRGDSEQPFDEREKDDESGSEFLLMTQHIAGSLANFFHSQLSQLFSQSEVYRKKNYMTCNTMQRFQNLVKTKADGKDQNKEE